MTEILKSVVHPLYNLTFEGVVHPPFARLFGAFYAPSRITSLSMDRACAPEDLFGLCVSLRANNTVHCEVPVNMIPVAPNSMRLVNPVKLVAPNFEYELLLTRDLQCFKTNPLTLTGLAAIIVNATVHTGMQPYTPSLGDGT